MTLHEAVYEAVCDVCFDKEYRYALFIKTFAELVRQAYSQGAVMEQGTVSANGIKSDLNARLDWSLIRRVSYLGPNELTLTIRLIDKRSGDERSSSRAVYDVSTGERIE